jgi:Tol biopolymer transport system component
MPEGMFLDSAPAVSPDSQQIAFIGTDTTGSRVFVRSLGSREALAIAGTEGAKQPFWSPDSKTLGYFANGKLIKVAWRGGAPVVVTDAPEARGGAWSPSGRIVFAPDVILAGLSTVSADGGVAAPVAQLRTDQGDNSHWWPQFLPDGIRFLYFVRSVADDRLGMYVGRLDRRVPESDPPLIRSRSEAVYAPLTGTDDGVLFFVVNGRVEARRFNAARLTVSADARSMGISGGQGTLYHPPMLGASAEVLAIAESPVPFGNRLESVRRNGQRVRLWDEAEAQNWPRVSPDGRYIARQRIDAQNNPDIWIDDVERGTRVRVTSALESDIQPVWSPDGRQMAYVSGSLPGRSGERTLQIAAVDGTGILRSLPCPAAYCEPTDWSRDGDTLLVNVVDTRGWDVWTVSTKAGDGARAMLAEAFTERDARFSPDGRWVAYVSNESGRAEVSVRATSGPPRRTVVSGDGGAQPVWRRDGAELFFVDPRGQLRSVSVNWGGDGAPRFGVSTQLSVPPIGFGHWGTQYDLSPDGSLIYLLRRNDDPPPRAIHVIIGWRALFE